MNQRRYFLSGLVFLILLLGIPSYVLAQKAYSGSRILELDNTRTEKIFNTGDAQVSESGVVRYLFNIESEPSSGDPETIAREFLNRESIRFGLKSEREELALRSISKSPGGQHVNFYQTLNGYPVHNSTIVVTLDNNNRVSFVSSQFQPNLNLKTLNPSISSSGALSIAKNYLDVKGKMIIEPKTELNVFESKREGTLLVYKVIIVTEDPMGDWEVLVNSANGEIVNVRDLMRYGNDKKANGKGTVYLPDPLTKAGVYYGGQFVDPGGNDADNPSINAQIDTLVLRDITFENGVYKLKGPYVKLEEIESPADTFPQLADSSAFNYTRSQQEFEDVNVYYHIDKSYRWLMQLGFNVPTLLQFRADPHGLSGDDNSHYSSSGNYCAWGEGGVDDAEDAAVIWHEYGHAIQENIVTGGMSYSGETQSLQEGCSDYWAASHHRSTKQFGWEQVFMWDAGNISASDVQGTFWPGRRCNLNWVYPQNYVSGHDGGQLWSSALMKIWEVLGREVTDKLFIQAHYIWGQSPNLKAAAQAFIQADRNLYNGAHLSTIVYWFDNRGLVNASQFMPSISHDQLKDTENMTGPYVVKAVITPSTQPMNPSKIKVVYGRNVVPQDTLTMVATGATNEYMASIPGNGSPATYKYYIFAADSANNLVYYPSNAPAGNLSFYAGPDTVKPVITHSALRDQALIRWPAKVKATVTDNLGVDTVMVAYIKNGTTTGQFALTSIGNNTYEGSFNVNVVIGDSINYKVVAIDNSTSQNMTVLPGTGYYKFKIIDTRGVVLVLNDDATSAKTVDEKGSEIRDAESLGKAAQKIAGFLNNNGFLADIEPFASSNSANWSNYNFVILASGINSEPANNADKRTALVNYVQAGGKLLVEGGELTYDYKGTKDVNFKTNILHIDDWTADNSAGDLVLQNPTHPIATVPNTLPANIGFTPLTSYADKDAVVLNSSAYFVYDFSAKPGNPGVIVYDNNPNPVSAQIVYLSFSLCSITDSTTWQSMLENVCEFLMATESAPQGSVAGKVTLTGGADNSGALVNITGPSCNQNFTTTASGEFSFTGLYAGNYKVKVVPPAGFYPYSAMQSGITVSTGPVTGINFNFDKIVYATVSGKVTLSDKTDHSGVIVQVVGQNTWMDTTDQAGNYQITQVMPGTISVKAFKPGYKGAMVDTSVQNNGTSLVFNFTLNPGVNAYEFDFENDNCNFACNSLWQWGVPASGPSAAFSGQKLWGTNLAGDYTNNNHSELTTPLIDLSGFSDVVLSFCHWYDMERSSSENGKDLTPDKNKAYDGGNIKISIDGGSTFKLIYPIGGYPDSIYTTSTANALAGQRVYSGQSVNWKTAEFNLKSYAGKQVVLKFDFGSDQSVVKKGWYIDMIKITDPVPVELSAFSVSSKDNNVIINWATSTEKNNKGFSIERRSSNSSFEQIAFLNGKGTTAEKTSYSYTDSKLPAGSYIYRLKQVDFDGQISYSKEIEAKVDAPKTYSLEQNYPNPFNPNTVIKYSIPVDGNVRLEVFNLLGERISTLVNSNVKAGTYEVTFDASRLASGIYIYRVESGSFVSIKKMMLLK